MRMSDPQTMIQRTIVCRHVIRISGLGNTPKGLGQQGDLVLEILIEEEDEDEE
jgi:hypothetical protein